MHMVMVNDQMVMVNDHMKNMVNDHMVMLIMVKVSGTPQICCTQIMKIKLSSTNILKIEAIDHIKWSVCSLLTTPDQRMKFHLEKTR